MLESLDIRLRCCPDIFSNTAYGFIWLSEDDDFAADAKLTIPAILDDARGEMDGLGCTRWGKVHKSNGTDRFSSSGLGG